MALAGGNSDAVNERIPVTKSEMEEHWQVSCAKAWEELRMTTTEPVSAGSCGVSAELVRQIQLCGFIYQAPGEQIQQQCPDYSSASQLLERRSVSTQCSDLLSSVEKLMDCEAGMD